MSKPITYKTCETCKGERFIKHPGNRHKLCPECGGDGCIWIKQKTLGEAIESGDKRLIEDIISYFTLNKYFGENHGNRK